MKLRHWVSLVCIVCVYVMMQALTGAVTLAVGQIAAFVAIAVVISFVIAILLIFRRAARDKD